MMEILGDLGLALTGATAVVALIIWVSAMAYKRSVKWPF